MKTGKVPVKAVIGDQEYSLSPLTKSIGFLVRVVQVQLNERLRAGGGLSVTPAIYSALQLIHANPGIRQVHAARILMVQESNMAILVKEMIANGFIERRKGNGKHIGLWTTEAGLAKLEVGPWAQDLDRQFASVLSDREYKMLLTLLDRVYRAAL